MNKLTLLAIPLVTFTMSFQASAQESSDAAIAVKPASIRPFPKDDGRVNNVDEAIDFYNNTQTKENFDKYAGDGGLSRDEYNQWMKDTRGEAGYDSKGGKLSDKRFEHADANGDGVVSLEEAKAQKKFEINNRGKIRDGISDRRDGDEMTRAEKLRRIANENPEKAAEILRDHPEARRKFFEKHPDIAKRLKNHPGAAKRLAERPRAVRAAIKHPNAAKTLATNPKARKAIVKHPGARRAVRNNPKAGKIGAKKAMNHKKAAGVAGRKALQHKGATKKAYRKGRNNKGTVRKANRNSGAAKGRYQKRRGR